MTFGEQIFLTGSGLSLLVIAIITLVSTGLHVCHEKPIKFLVMVAIVASALMVSMGLGMVIDGTTGGQ